METHAFGFRPLASAPEGQKRFPIGSPRVGGDMRAHAFAQKPAQFRQLPLSSGRPLDRLTREFFDHRFDFDFSRVRIHTDGEAAAGGKPEQDIPLTEFRDAYTTSPASALLDQPEKGKNLGPLARDTHVAVMEEPASETRGKWSKIVVIDGTKAGTVGWVKSDALAYK